MHSLVYILAVRSTWEVNYFSWIIDSPWFSHTAELILSGADLWRPSIHVGIFAHEFSGAWSMIGACQEPWTNRRSSCAALIQHCGLHADNAPVNDVSLNRTELNRVEMTLRYSYQSLPYYYTHYCLIFLETLSAGYTNRPVCGDKCTVINRMC